MMKWKHFTHLKGYSVLNISFRSTLAFFLFEQMSDAHELMSQ